MHEILFEAETPTGKLFDYLLLILILVSVLAVMLESVASFRERYGTILLTTEWVLTLIFTAEYVLRLLCVGRPGRYARSLFGVVDLLAILPTYLSLVVTGTHSLLVIRALRLLRAFRVLKLAHFVGEARLLRGALRASASKIAVFLFTILTVVVIIGSVMYLVEGPENGFTNIPQSIYWAIVTMTTVGYGDVAPHTVLGKFLASLVMISGYGVLAVPTGIVTVELAHIGKPKLSTRSCEQCAFEGHDPDARYCKRCGARL